jgi:hypothetical protein
VTPANVRGRASAALLRVILSALGVEADKVAALAIIVSLVIIGIGLWIMLF